SRDWSSDVCSSDLRMADIPAIHPSHEVAFMSTALSMVSAGLGVTAGLPYAQTLVDLYGLRMRPLLDPVIRRQFFIYSRLHASPPPATQAFVRHLHEHVGERDWDATAEA